MDKHYEPYKVIILIFLIALIIGSTLLYLPISHDGNVKFIDAFFTATSALCVTGLNTIDFANTFNTFGITVIAILIQLGGLGIICTGFIIALILGQKIGLKKRLLLKASFNLNSIKGIIKLLLNIIKITVIIELLGIIFLSIYFIKDYNLKTSIALATFHSISAFNNAGFDIISKYNLLNNYTIIISSILIILGGLGFLVIEDILNKKKLKTLTLHSKIVIKVSLLLIVFGTITIYLLENFSLLESFYLSVSSRTAGFSINGFNLISNSTTLIIIFLMFVGASPSSTGGGIKTTTFYTLLKGMISIYTNRNCVSNKRTIKSSVIHKSFVIFISAIGIIFLSTLFISIIEKDFLLKDILFEVTSAFCTVGYTLGITPRLSIISKIIICICMFIGRVGTLTLISMWLKEKKDNVKYPEENIIVG